MASNDARVPSTYEHCRNCGAEMAPGKEECIACGTRVRASEPKSSTSDQQTPNRGVLSFRSFTHLLIVGLLTAFFYYSYPGMRPFLSQMLPVLSPLVDEVVARANADPKTAEILGLPIKSGWRVKGYIRPWDQTSGEAELWIPVSGTKSEGTIFAKAFHDDSPWVFSELLLLKDGIRLADLFAASKAATLSIPIVNRRVYIIPLGSLPDLGLSELPAYYRNRFGLTVELLPPIELDDSVRDQMVNKVVDDKIEEFLQRRIPRVANDPNAVIIGVISEDMYVKSKGTFSMYNRFTIRGNFGLVSTYMLTPHHSHPHGAELLKTRVRKLISRDIGMSGYNFPTSDDLTSLVSRKLSWVRHLDKMSESYEGIGPHAMVDEYRVARNEPSYKPEILSSYSKEQLKKADGRYPCLLIKRQRKVEAEIAKFVVNRDRCLPKSFMNGYDTDEVEIDLRSGQFVSRTTDFYFQGTSPVTLTRCYRTRDYRSRTFGWNTSLSWDISMGTDKNPYTYVVLNLCDGSTIHYKRISKGVSFADALFEHRQTSTEFLGSRMRWNGNAWVLNLVDGTSILFPGTYNARRGVDNAPIEFWTARGEPVKIERDRRRNLKRLTTPGQNTVEFEYDPWDRVVAAVDGQRRINYSYDVAGRLIEVQKSGVKTRIDYDYERITAIHENDRRLIEFTYSMGLLNQISLNDGRKYKLRYDADLTKHNSKILGTQLTEPDGSVSTFKGMAE